MLPLLLLVPLALVRPPRGVASIRLLLELWLGLCGSVAAALLLAGGADAFLGGSSFTQGVAPARQAAASSRLQMASQNALRDRIKR